MLTDDMTCNQWVFLDSLFEIRLKDRVQFFCHTRIHYRPTESHCRVDSAVIRTRGLWFECQPVDPLFGQKFFIVSLGPSLQMTR
jgi:hypothetical protein